MDTEKQLQNIEKELKLLKGELKQALTSVREQLLNTPPSPTMPSKPGNGGGHKADIKGFSLPPASKAGHENKPSDKLLTENEEASEEAEPSLSIPELPQEEPVTDGNHSQLDMSVPKVNLLANLISWSSIARKEIGSDQLPALLEVYGISGNLSPDVKDIILHLAEVTADKASETSTAESWSNSILSLHGILTGNDAPLNTVQPESHPRNRYRWLGEPASKNTPG